MIRKVAELNGLKLSPENELLEIQKCHEVCVAECYSVLQCVAVCCSVLQCVAVCCSVLQCVAVA